MLTNIVIYILCCFLVSLIISIFLPFNFEEQYSYLEEYICSLAIGFFFSAFIVPLIIGLTIIILILLGVSIAIILFSTVGCIYLLNSYFGVSII